MVMMGTPGRVPGCLPNWEVLMPAGPIPNRKPRRKKVGVRALVHALDGPERPYPVYKFSSRQIFERPNHNPFDGL